mmetsp:Transcript_18191/g.45509  ORF Transcript_18191/g.45509 Transcript_18191/m.45509 type:complete len:476 (+) Transcript_18191:858-2285(+)
MRRRVALLEPSVVYADDFVFWLHHLCVYCSLYGFRHDGCDVHWLVLGGLRHLEHEAPVRSLLLFPLRAHRLASVAELYRLQLFPRVWAVAFGVEGEHRATVERAVRLGKVEPTLYVVRAEPAQADSNHVRRRVVQPFVLGVLEPGPAGSVVERKGREQLAVTDRTGGAGLRFPVLRQLLPRREFRRGVDFHDSSSELHLVLRQQAPNFFPDATCAALHGKAKHRVGAPARIRLVLNNVCNHLFCIDGGHALAEPIAAHFGGWIRPHLEVVWSHEQICDAPTHHLDDPLVKILRRSCYLPRVEHAVDALDFVCVVQFVEVVLERVRHPPVLDPHVAHALVQVPVLVANAARRVKELVEVVPVTEDDVSAHVEQESLVGLVGHGQSARLFAVSHHEPGVVAELVEPGRGAEAAGAGAENKHVSFLVIRHGGHVCRLNFNWNLFLQRGVRAVGCAENGVAWLWRAASGVRDAARGELA